MRFNKRFKPELCTKQTTRGVTNHALEHVLVDRKNKRLVATTGEMLVSVPCILEDDESTGPALVSPATLEAARKATGRDAIVGMHIALAGCTLANGVTHPAPTEEAQAFPHHQHVMPKFSPGDAGTVSIACNPTLLLALAKALDSANGVTLTWEATNPDVMRVESVHFEGDAMEGVGVLMGISRPHIAENKLKAVLKAKGRKA